MGRASEYGGGRSIVCVAIQVEARDDVHYRVSGKLTDDCDGKVSRLSRHFLFTGETDFTTDACYSEVSACLRVPQDYVSSVAHSRRMEDLVQRFGCGQAGDVG